MFRRRLAEAGGVLIGAVALTAALTYPVAFRIDRVGCLNADDGQFSLWNVAWVSHALLTDPATLYDTNIFYPHRGTLAFSEANIVAGVMGLPAYWITGNPFATQQGGEAGIGTAQGGQAALLQSARQIGIDRGQMRGPLLQRTAVEAAKARHRNTGLVA